MALKFCSIASGSSGNCQYIESENASLLLDAGLTGKKITEGLSNIYKKPEGLDAILVTHEHIDHIKGIGVLSRKYDIPIYANTNTWEQMENKIGKINNNNIKTFTTGEEFYINDILIRTCAISHDAIEPVAFSFLKDQIQVSVVTDLGCVDSNIISEMIQADFIMVEANHDTEMLKMGNYPWHLKQRILGDKGHLSNEAAGYLLAEIINKGKNIKQILLAHLSKENNFPELAYQTIKNILEDKKIFIGQDINIDLTYRDKVSKIYNITKERRCAYELI